MFYSKNLLILSLLSFFFTITLKGAEQIEEQIEEHVIGEFRFFCGNTPESVELPSRKIQTKKNRVNGVKDDSKSPGRTNSSNRTIRTPKYLSSFLVGNATMKQIMKSATQPYQERQNPPLSQARPAIPHSLSEYHPNAFSNMRTETKNGKTTIYLQPSINEQGKAICPFAKCKAHEKHTTFFLKTGAYRQHFRRAEHPI